MKVKFDKVFKNLNCFRVSLWLFLYIVMLLVFENVKLLKVVVLEVMTDEIIVNGSVVYTR